MELNNVLLGQRLRAARENCGTSQDDVAQQLGLPRAAIARMEAGQRSVDTLELAELARIYSRPVGYFFEAGPEQDSEDALVALYRTIPGTEETPERKRALAHLVEVCRIGAELEAVLEQGRNSAPLAYEIPEPTSVADAVDQGTEVAEAERGRLELGAAPIASLAELLTSQGIWAAATELPDDVSGLFFRHKSVGLVVLVNNGHARARRRFSYAHEYAHALLDRDRAISVSSVSNASQLIETRANAFAAALLLPARGVRAFLTSLNKGGASREEHPVYDVARNSQVSSRRRVLATSQSITPQDVAMLGHYFGVSYQATAYRLRSLGQLTHSECQGLLTSESTGRAFLEATNLGKDFEAKDQDSPELTHHVAHLAIEAFRREEISRGRLLEVARTLGLSGRKLVEAA
ncbi:MAG: ImmA/IrrE family metallo-endopeptidase [Candidatus Eisenbacteria bacterium]|nr:ImmA/IrrE family metallo-endopeptidase [Candidatus Eisenbacteria bacterium]